MLIGFLRLIREKELEIKSQSIKETPVESAGSGQFSLFDETNTLKNQKYLKEKTTLIHQTITK